MRQGLTFDDVFLVPIHSEIRSRKDPDPSTVIGKNLLKKPIIAAPMTTVVGVEMCKSLTDAGATAVIHRYCTIDEQVSVYSSASSGTCFAAIGASGDFLERATALREAGCTNFCIDVANGHSIVALEATKSVRKEFPEVDIMAGNVCTLDGASCLRDAGANIIRVGIGGGSVCSTRLVTGFGVPQFTAIEDVCLCEGVHVVADGGIRSSGDIVKALAAGADAVMIGGLFAGTDQAPGYVKQDSNGNRYKLFHGMASSEARSEHFSKELSSFVPEGVSTKVPYKGDVVEVLNNLVDGLKVGMTFANATNLSGLYCNAEWIRVTDNGRREGNPNKRLHSV